jgi:hypothetical protein
MRVARSAAVALLALYAISAQADDAQPPVSPPPGEKAEKEKPGAAGADPSKPAGDAPKAAEPPAVAVPVVMNPNCPIMGKPSSALLFTDTEKGRIYLCCAPCARKVRKDPDRAYEAAFPTSRKAGNTVCPVTGKAVDGKSPTVVLQGVEIAVATEDAKKLAPSMAQIVLAKALDPGVREVGNVNCPITGKPVAVNAYCLVGKDLVRLSSAECVEDVRKDPERALAKAREDAATAKARSRVAPDPGASPPKEKEK